MPTACFKKVRTSVRFRTHYYTLTCRVDVESLRVVPALKLSVKSEGE